MIERLTDEETIKRAELRLKALIEAHAEWLYAEGAGASVSLRKGECDLHVSHGRLIFSCWTDRGLTVWRIRGWEWTGEKILLEASRRMGAEVARLELIPRATHEDISVIISDTRRERCRQLAELACAAIAGAKVERASLSAGARKNQPGRYARILLRHHNHERIAVAGAISESGRHDTEAFLSSTLLWFTRLSERTVRPPLVRQLWLVAGKDCVDALGKLVALLRDELRRVMMLYEIDDEWRELTPVPLSELNDLWKKRVRARLARPPLSAMSESAARIVAHAPEAIDVVGARHGETLRYHGLAFARVRRVIAGERIWFGVEGARRRLLDNSTLDDWSKLLRDLKEHRRADCSDTRHALYRASPEAWLESELRRDITRLDPGLRLAPLYAQFRPLQAGKGAGSRPVDLLALRQDGRLVVIELKVSEDREHVIQGADYWRRVELHRRSGHIEGARLFGDAAISDEPPLVYLVAPLLRFHRAFDTLARCLRTEIEVYRFDLGEDWRARVRVVRRCDLMH
jgi:hypothetical protein